MKSLTRLRLDENVDINYVETVLSSGDVQIEFRSLDIFKQSFNKFSIILWDYAERIKSLYAPTEGSIFEDTVTILSTLEDKLEISINNLVIDAGFGEEAKEIIDFYCDDILFSGMTISLHTQDINRGDEVFKTPIDVIAYIERGNFFGISIMLEDTSRYLNIGVIWEACKKYVGAIYGLEAPAEIVDTDKIFICDK